MRDLLTPAKKSTKLYELFFRVESSTLKIMTIYVDRLIECQSYSRSELFAQFLFQLILSHLCFQGSCCPCWWITNIFMKICHNTYTRMVNPAIKSHTDQSEYTLPIWSFHIGSLIIYLWSDTQPDKNRYIMFGKKYAIIVILAWTFRHMFKKLCVTNWDSGVWKMRAVGADVIDVHYGSCKI